MAGQTELPEIRAPADDPPPWQVMRSGYIAAVYLQMAAAVMLSAAAAALVTQSVLLAGLLFTANGLTATGWIVTFAPLILVIILGAGVERLSVGAARALFVLYAILTGLSLGGIAFAYSGGSIAYGFAAAAAAFAGLGAVGMFAKRDLGALGSFLTICLFGLIAAMLINLFMQSRPADLLLAAVGVLLFAGLTAFDVQRLRKLQIIRPQEAVIGALTLYLDFLNLFLSLLRLTGRRRR